MSWLDELQEKWDNFWEYGNTDPYAFEDARANNEPVNVDTVAEPTHAEDAPWYDFLDDWLTSDEPSTGNPAASPVPSRSNAPAWLLIGAGALIVYAWAGQK